MRWIVAILFLTAGCMGASETQENPAGAEGGAAMNETLPDPQSYSGVLLGGAGPIGCELGCPVHEFVSTANGTMYVDLSWTIDQNDIDIFVYHEGNPVGEGIEVPPQTSEHVEVELKPGTYTFEIYPYQSIRDEYSLNLTFE